MPETRPVNLLLIANHTCPCPALPAEVRVNLGTAEGRVLVVAPALNSRLRHWTSDTDAAMAGARDRVGAAVGLLRGAGLTADGEVGDADPMTAMEDALRAFAADAVLISTWPPERSHWLEKDLIGRARTQLDIPVHHTVSCYGLAAPEARLAG